MSLPKLKLKQATTVKERRERFLIRQDVMHLLHIEEPSEAVQLLAVVAEGLMVQWLHEPSERVQLYAVENNSDALGYISEPSMAVQLRATSANGLTIRFIERPSREVQFNAVTQNAEAIKHIRTPSEQLQVLAVAQNGYILRHIGGPWAVDVIARAIDVSPQLVFDPEFSGKITKDVLDAIRPGLGLQVEVIRTMTDDCAESAVLLQAIYPGPLGNIQADLPDHELPLAATL